MYLCDRQEDQQVGVRTGWLNTRPGEVTMAYRSLVRFSNFDVEAILLNADENVRTVEVSQSSHYYPITPLDLGGRMLGRFFSIGCLSTYRCCSSVHFPSLGL